MLLPAPFASAQSQPWESREQGWSPKGPGVPDLWVSHIVVQRETADLSVIEFDSADATIHVLSPEGILLYSHDLHMQSYGTGYYGNVSWRVPASATPGTYTVNATGGRGGVSTTMQVLAGPHLFAGCDLCGPGAQTVSLEAVGFDAAPVTADFLQGNLRWSASWPDGRGLPRTVGDFVEANVPGAANPRLVLGAGDGSESVIIRPQLVVETGEPLLAWFNGTIDGTAASLSWNWTMPTREPGVLIRVTDQAYVGDPLSVVVYGLREGNVTLAGNSRGPQINASAGFFQGVLDPDRVGNTSILVKGTTIAGEAFHAERALRISPRPVAMADGGGVGPHATIPSPSISTFVFVAILSVLARRRR